MQKLPWLRSSLAAHWGNDYACQQIVPLSKIVPVTVTHTSEHWLVGPPDRLSVLKVARKHEFGREWRFYVWKRDVLDFCRRRGVPVAAIRGTCTQSPCAEVDGRLLEMTEFVGNACAYTGVNPQVDAMIAATLDLRAALDALPACFCAGLRKCPLPKVVEEDRLELVLDEAHRQLPIARNRRDPWARAAARQLAALCSASRLLAHLPATSQDAVVHGDLHGYNILCDVIRSSSVRAILDFDNMHAGSRLLDLAWIADTAAWGLGGRENWNADRASRAVHVAIRRGLMAPCDAAHLMPLLIAYAAPIILDIAKDILHRRIFAQAWFRYFDILAIDRKLRIDVDFQKCFE